MASETKNVVNVNRLIRSLTQKRVSPAFREKMYDFLVECAESQIAACEAVADLKNQKTLLESHWMSRSLESANPLNLE
jgi:histone H3/H4